MDPDELLYRNVHPNSYRDGRLTSTAFKPHPSEPELSVDRSSMRLPAESFERYPKQSVGVVAVSVEECEAHELPVIPDPIDGNPSHALISFAGLGRNQIDKKAKRLKRHAIARTWRFGPINLNGRD